MTHLASNSTATAREQVLATDWTGRQPRYRLHPLRAVPAKPVFYSRMANFLEMAVAAFHYSVTGGYAAIDMAPGLASRPRLIDDVTVSAARGDAADAPHAKNDASNHLGRSQLQPGERKSDAKDSDFADTIQLDIKLANSRMMEIGVNIHATYPPYAAVAPILHTWVWAIPTGRGTTPNTGATDADGR